MNIYFGTHSLENLYGKKLHHLEMQSFCYLKVRALRAFHFRNDNMRITDRVSQSFLPRQSH